MLSLEPQAARKARERGEIRNNSSRPAFGGRAWRTQFNSGGRLRPDTSRACMPLIFEYIFKTLPHGGGVRVAVLGAPPFLWPSPDSGRSEEKINLSRPTFGGRA
jgi:hypothetical protein